MKNAYYKDYENMGKYGIKQRRMLNYMYTVITTLTNM